MKLNASITTHFIAFLSMVLFSAPVKYVSVSENVSEEKIERIEKNGAEIKQSSALSLSDILFRY
jgi:hypothetical protein